jgi:ADP-L-glycero-D-manno-heptose 6-epimerase
LKILITGNRGFIGSHVERFWRKLEGHEIVTYEWNEQLLPRIEGLDWVLHFGAISSTTERDVAKVMRQNYDFSVWLYEECRKYDVDMQWSSSASVYGSGSDFRESAAVDPRSPYSWSKYLFEHYVDKNPTHRRCQGFRYFNVHGENEQHKGSQASPHFQFALQAQVSGVIRVFEGSDDFKRDFVPVDLVVGTQFQFIMQDIQENGIWNIGTGQATSFMDVAKKYAEQYGALIQQIPMPENLKASYQYYTCADLTKLQQTLGLDN